MLPQVIHFLRLALPYLLLLTLAIGPIWMGSYYGEWRNPLLNCTWAVAALAFLLGFYHKHFKRFSFWGLLLCLFLIIGQGYWMHYNSQSQFIKNEIIDDRHYFWEFIPRLEQPHPDLPGGYDQVESWDRLSYIIPGLLLCLGTYLLIAKRILRLSTLCGGIFWIGVGIAALGLIQRFTGAEAIYWNDEFFDRHRQLFFATFRSPGIATCYMNICLALGLGHLLSTAYKAQRSKHPKPTHTLLVSIGLIVLLAGAMTAGSKAGMLFAGATVLLSLLLQFRGFMAMLRNASSLLPSGSPHERNLIVGAISVAMIFAVLSFGGTVVKRWERSEKSNHNTLTLRHIANSVQLEMIEDKDWKATGYGPGSFYLLFPLYTQEKGNSIRGIWVYAHNDHLQTLVEWGWFGTGCFVFLIGGAGVILLFESFAKRRRHRTAHIFYAKGIAVAMFICLCNATVDFPFQIESIAITFAAILGAAWAVPTLRVGKK